MKFIKTEDGILKEYKPQGRFIPKYSERYWLVENNGRINFIDNVNSDNDNYIIAHNLVFRTHKECMEYKWFLDQLDEYKTDFYKEDCENIEIEKHCLYFEHENQCINVFVCQEYQDQGTIYFTKENIEKFIETVGEERIKKYMFDVWE